MTRFLVGASTLRSPTENQPWPGPFIMPTSCFQPLKFSPSSLIFSSWPCQSHLSGICTNAVKRSTASLQHLPSPVASGSVRLYPHSHETLHGAAPIKTGSFAEIYLGIVRANTPALTPLVAKLKRAPALSQGKGTVSKLGVHLSFRQEQKSTGEVPAAVAA